MARALLSILALILAVGLALSAAGPAAAQGPTIQLAVLLDGSGSIDDTEWDTQINGLATAIADENCIPHDSSVELTVIQFAGRIGGGAKVEVQPIVINDDSEDHNWGDGDVYWGDVATKVLAISQREGNTPLHAGIKLAVAQITGSSNFPKSLKQIINIATDGGEDSCRSLRKFPAQVAREEAKRAGIDEIDAEGIGDIPLSRRNWADVYWLRDYIVWPQDGTIADPPDVPFTPGWVYMVGVDAGKFKEAIGHKIPPPPLYQVDVSSNPPEGGTVAPGSGQYAGDTMFTASENTGYDFVNWTINGFTGETDNPLTLDIQAATTLVANFSEEPPPLYPVDVSSNPPEGGTVAPGSGQYAGDTMFTASENPGYDFVNWTINGLTGETDNPLTLDIQAATTLVANFSEEPPPLYQVDVNSNPPQGGTVAPGSGQYAGDTMFTASENTGYDFVNWTINGSTGEMANPLTLDIQAATTLVANFSEEPTPSPPPSRREERTPAVFDRTVTPGVSETTFAFSTAETIVGDHSVELGVTNLQNEQEGTKIAFPVWEKGDPEAPGWGEVTLQDIDASSISLKVKGDVLYDEGVARSPCPLIVITFSPDTYRFDGRLQDRTGVRDGPHIYFYPTDASGSGPVITVSGDPMSEWATVTPANPQYWKGFFLNGDDVGEFLGVVGPTDLGSWHDAMVNQAYPLSFYWHRYKVKMGVGYGFVIGGSTVYVDDLAVKIGSDLFTFDFEPGTAGSVGGACFIATAAYGSYLDSHVETLQEFRDQYLVTNPVGSSLVSLYYKVSPPVAEFIDEHPALKPIVRVGLLPAVAMSTVAVNTTSAEKLAILGGLTLVSLALVTWLRRRARV